MWGCGRGLGGDVRVGKGMLGAAGAWEGAMSGDAGLRRGQGGDVESWGPHGGLGRCVHDHV